MGEVKRLSEASQGRGGALSAVFWRVLDSVNPYANPCSSTAEWQDWPNYLDEPDIKKTKSSTQRKTVLGEKTKVVSAPTAAR